MKDALMFLFGYVLIVIVVAGAWLLSTASLIEPAAHEWNDCTDGNVFTLNGQFYQCVKVKPEVVK